MQQLNNLIEFASATLMAEKLADVIEAKLALGLIENGHALLAVSGGSTPKALYQKLSQRDLPWDKIIAVIIDERWVTPQEQGSNEKFIRENLQINRAQNLAVMGLWRDAPDPLAALERAEADLKEVFKPFDAAVLGMGADGHTASWFAHAKGLDKALYGKNLLAAIKAKQSDITGAHVQRMTLSLAALQEAKFSCLLMQGEEKRACYLQARKEGAVEDMPVRALFTALPALWACWTP